MGESDPEVDPLLGVTVAGKYRVVRSIGRGGMGAVYEAVNTSINKRVALKFLDREATRDRDAVTRFQREAEAASAVESAHIVDIFDSGQSEDGLPFLVMELLRGEDLRSRLRREGRLELDVALRIAAQVLRALARAHEAGIIHRDLKPDNVFLCARDDDPEFVKIVDFGISKLSSASLDTLTRRGTVLGTAFYMSPEQAQAFPDIDGRADLFSLGAILYETLAGRPPHTGRVYEAVLVSICTTDSPDIRLHAPNVPERVARLLAKALARDRDARFESAAEFLDALREAAPDLPLPGASEVRSLKARVSDSSEPPSPGLVDTAQGSTVRSRRLESAGRQRARALVTAFLATVAAFGLTVLLLSKRGGSSEAQPDLPRTAASIAPVPPPAAVVPPPAASSPAADPDAGADPRTAEPIPPPPAKPPASPRKPQKNGATKAPSPPREPGIAGGLHLNTQGP
jgi:serine/threonine-protein kinase